MPGDRKGATADSLMSQLGKKKKSKRLRTEDIDPEAMARSAGHMLTPNVLRWTKTLWNAGQLMRQSKAERDSLSKR